jgi:hypothetical protein
MSAMKRHEFWRQRYRENRDLDHLLSDDLSDRIHDCINNFRTRTERNKLGFLQMNQENGEEWMVLFTEVLEECALRKYSYPGPISIAKYRDAMDHAFDPIPDMDRALKEIHAKDSNYLLKFGDPFWLKQSIESGNFRIASASYYDCQEHNHARRDTELKRFCCPNPSHSEYQEFESCLNETDILKDDHWKSVNLDTDYLLFCLSNQYSSRLFGDFHSTACLVITDPKLFLDKLLTAIAPKINGWQFKVVNVTYYDPIRIDPRQIVVPEFKPFKHAYQKETRVVFLPPQQASIVDPIEVEIGAMHNYATLIDLESHPTPNIPYDPKDDPIQHYGNIKRESTMLSKLPDAKKVQGISLYKEGRSHKDWYFNVQYIDESDKWHEIKISMLDGLYLKNLLSTAEKEQGLGLFNRR